MFERGEEGCRAHTKHYRNKKAAHECAAHRRDQTRQD